MSDQARDPEVLWQGEASARWAWVLSIGSALGGLAILVAGLAGSSLVLTLTGLLFVVIAAAGFPFTSIQVEIDAVELRIGYSPFRWTLTRLARSSITAVEAIDLRPMAWGGWGYRRSRRLFKRAAVVLRAGPALRLDLDDGTELAITVDDPETAARILSS